MNPRHAVALTLVGWYLMLPPVHDGQPDTQAPISAWTVFCKFDSAAACQEWKLRLETRARRSGLPALVVGVARNRGRAPIILDGCTCPIIGLAFDVIARPNYQGHIVGPGPLPIRY